jgi:DNA-binding NarL/FixJ family response regulator
MRVALADDSVLFRSGLQRLLADLDVEVLYAVGTSDELLLRAGTDPPEVAILDIRMPPTFTDEGLRAAERLHARSPHIGVLLLSTYAETPDAARLLSGKPHGVGYLLKDRVDDPAQLLDALVRIAQGECVVDAEVVSTLIRQERHADHMDRLTERERLVLQLMAEGRSNAGIGSQLYLSPKTVETHVGSVFSKLGLPPEAVDNRRVMAVLTWLRTQRGDSSPPAP